jgi:hypothetical protein
MAYVTGRPAPGQTTDQPGGDQAGGADGSVAIEATTGAPLAALPQRAPLRGSGVWADPRPIGAPTAADPGGDTDPDEPAFWLPIEEVHWDGTPVERDTRSWLDRLREARTARRRAPRPPRPPRGPAYGLTATLALALVTSFFAWVSAEPLWVASGHAKPGVAVVHGCAGHGLALSCRGEFTSADRSFTVLDVRLSGVVPGDRDRGDRVAARMVGPHGGRAYAGTDVDPHLRGLLGLVLALLCGPATVWATGARRLADPRSRRAAALAGLAAPALLTAGFLVAAY